MTHSVALAGSGGLTSGAGAAVVGWLFTRTSSLGAALSICMETSLIDSSVSLEGRVLLLAGSWIDKLSGLCCNCCTSVSVCSTRDQRKTVYQSGNLFSITLPLIVSLAGKTIFPFALGFLSFSALNFGHSCDRAFTISFG